MTQKELEDLLTEAKRTTLLNPADRECSPEGYVNEFAARLALIIEDQQDEIAKLVRDLRKIEEYARKELEGIPPTIDVAVEKRNVYCILGRSITALDRYNNPKGEKDARETNQAGL